MELNDKFRDSIEIRDTPVGYGVFARRKFPKRRVLGEVKGEIIIDGDHGSDYCMDLGKDISLEPGPPFRFLNHSCEPNCELVLWKKRKTGGRKHWRLWVQALRKIEPGEELTIDYAWPAEVAVPCHCHSARCRGWIVHESEVGQLMLDA